MVRSLRALLLVLVLLLFPFSALPQDALSGPKALERALALADLYNWADAAPLFAQAKASFEQAGDSRNALYARLGLLRANIERQQQTLPTVSHELGIELEENPHLQTDKRLRLFALIVKGDIDAETDTAAMKQDWQEAQTLARQLGDTKWTYRSLGQLGVAAFYDGDMEAARKLAGAAMEAAIAAADIGAQIRMLTILGRGLVETKAFDEALAYLDKALALGSSVPASGYAFPTQQVRIAALIGGKRFDEAGRLIDQVRNAAVRENRPAHEAIAIGLAAELTFAKGSNHEALAQLQLAMDKAEAIGLVRIVSRLHAAAAELYRRLGDLQRAEHHLVASARAAQLSGDMWAVPQRLHLLAELRRARGQYDAANETYERAEAIVDSLVGKSSTALEKMALIRSASDIYTSHVSLLADHFKDAGRAYAVVEQVRGRIAVDQLLAGTVRSTGARKVERTIAALRLKLMHAESTREVKRLRDEMFMLEQARWAAPGVSILKRRSSMPVDLHQVQEHLPAGTTLLEYVVAAPSSYCVVLTSSTVKVVPIGGRDEMEKLTSSFLAKVKARQPTLQEGRRLYNLLIRPTGIQRTSRLVVVRDGPLHLLPFEALVEPNGRYLAETSTVSYAPSATSFHLLSKEMEGQRSRSMLGVGGVEYTRSSMNTAGIERSNQRSRFAELPSSGEEIRAAASALGAPKTTILSGNRATETAFKRADLGSFQFIHLAVHGFADPKNPDRAALVMLSDPQNGEDGFLYAPEVVQLGLSAELVVLSACETAVGPLQGQEGIANLSRAFLFAGSRSVISTLWEADDASSALLIKLFYAHMSEGQAPDSALAAAKRGILRKYGARAVPYLWAGFIIEGGTPSPQSQTRRTTKHVADARTSQSNRLKY